MLAIGVTFVIISGGIDLSIGTVLTLSGVMTGVFIVDMGLPVPLGVLGGLLTGAACGLFNGVTIAKMKIPPFIATLGTMMIAKGLALILFAFETPLLLGYPRFQQDRDGHHYPRAPLRPSRAAVLILFGAAIIASLILRQDDPGAL